MKDRYTTGEVARICEMTARSALSYCEKGKIKASRTPVTRRWSIAREDLLTFMEEHGISGEAIDTGSTSVTLMVDDDQADIAIYKRIIDSCFPSTEFIAFTDAVEALIEIGATAPDLVIIDILMPGIDGFQVCSKIKSMAHLRNTKVLFLTGLDDPELALKVERSQADGFLIKSHDYEDAARDISREIERLTGMKPVHTEGKRRIPTMESIK